MPKRRHSDGSLLDSLPWTMGALGFSLLPHVPSLPVWITAALLIAGSWRLLTEKRRGIMPGIWIRGILALACFLGILTTYGTIEGVGPGSALLAVMGAMKLLETARRRDQFVVLFIAIFLTMSALLREQYLWSLPYLLISLLLTLTAWIRMSAEPDERIALSASTAGRMLLYAAPVAVAMWVLFPRIATPFWSVPVDSGSGVSGLSDEMSPGDISSLSLSNAVAFRAYFSSSTPEQKDLYWRGLVLNTFDGRSWTGGEPRIGAAPDRQLNVAGDPTSYRVVLEPTKQQYLFALDMPYRWNLKRSFMGPQQQLATEHPIDQRVAYEVESYTTYRAQVDLREPFQSWYLQLQPNDDEGNRPTRNPKTLALARSLRAGASDDRAFIRAVLERFNQEDYYYTLEPPPLGSNPVDRFLFDTKQGFCEHYASAFAVMMRAAGVPARVVLGYQGGEMHPSGDYMVVRQADAHAWTEVWLDGEGWRRVDPTAAVAPERVELGRSGAVADGIASRWGMTGTADWLYDAQMLWDGINARWNDWILGYGPDKQEEFLEWLGMDDPNWTKMLLTLVIIVAAVVLAISVIMTLRNRPPRPDEAARLFQSFVRRIGNPRQIGETPEAWARRVADEHSVQREQLARVTGAYLEARYGEPSDDTLSTLKNVIRKAS